MSESDRVKMAWFENHVILQNVFRHLPLPCVKIARLVSPTWSKEGAKNFKIVVTVMPHNINDHNLKEILNFIHTHQIGHTLDLSFFDKDKRNWEYRSPFGTRETDDYQLHSQESYNQVIREEVVSEIMTKISPTNNLVRDLRLEIMIRNKEEGHLFSQIFQEMVGLKRLALELIDWNEEGLKYLMEPKCKIKSLGLLIHDKEQHTAYVPGPLEVYLPVLRKCVERLLRLFHTFEFLDTQGWRRYVHVEVPRYCRYYTRACLETISDTRLQNDSVFPNFQGLRFYTNRGYPILWQQIRSIKSLRDLYLIVTENQCYRNENECISSTASNSPEIYKTLVAHGNSLVTFDLLYQPVRSEDRHNFSLPHLPKLRYLGVSNIAYCTWQEFTPAILDILNLRHLLMSGNANFNKLLPSLESLCVTFHCCEEMPKWDHIFPKWDHIFPEQAEAISQIKSLSISLISECDTSFIQRLYKIFPNLYTFRHISKKINNDQEKFHVCHHEPDLQNVQTIEFDELIPECNALQHWCFELEKNLELRFNNSPCFIGRI